MDVIFPLFFVIFGSVFTFVPIFVGRSFFKTSKEVLSNAFASRKWPSVEGIINSSSVQKHRSHDGTSYSSLVSYSYSNPIDGRNFKSKTVKFGMMGAAGRGSAHKTVNKYPPKKKVNVYYDPMSPRNAVLEPGLRLRDIFLFIFFSIIMFVMIIIGFLVLSVGILMLFFSLFN